MRKLLTATAAAAMMFGATAAYSQTTTPELYVVGEGDDMRVMGGENTEGAIIVGDDTYEMPSDCPEGAYYRSGENTLTACGEEGGAFMLTEPASGTMMGSGQAFPQGARMMTPREDQNDNASTSGTTGVNSGSSTDSDGTTTSDTPAGGGGG